MLSLLLGLLLVFSFNGISLQALEIQFYAESEGFTCNDNPKLLFSMKYLQPGTCFSTPPDMDPYHHRIARYGADELLAYPDGIVLTAWEDISCSIEVDRTANKPSKEMTPDGCYTQNPGENQLFAGSYSFIWIGGEPVDADDALSPPPPASIDPSPAITQPSSSAPILVTPSTTSIPHTTTVTVALRRQTMLSPKKRSRGSQRPVAG